MTVPFWNTIFRDALPDPRYKAGIKLQNDVHKAVMDLFQPGWKPDTATTKNLALASTFAVVAQCQSEYDAYAAQAGAGAAAANLVNRARNAFEAAFAATDVYIYQPIPGLYPTGYARLTGPQIAALGISKSIKLTDPQTGLDAALYCKGTPGKAGAKYILANRGTDDGHDFWSNFMQDVGLPAWQYEQAVAAAKAITGVVDKTHGTIIFAGHSLGGGLATLQGMVMRRPTYVFQTSGVALATLQAHGAANVPAEQFVTAFDYHGDWLDNLQAGQGGFILRAPIGRKVLLPRIDMHGAANDNPNDWHLMNFVAPAMLQMLKAGSWP